MVSTTIGIVRSEDHAIRSHSLRVRTLAPNVGHPKSSVLVIYVGVDGPSMVRRGWRALGLSPIRCYVESNVNEIFC